MIGNIFWGFIIPWVFGFWLYKQDKKLILLIVPLSVTLSFIINLFGFHFGFWSFTPILKTKELSVFPLNVGLYPMLSSYLIYLIQKNKLHPYILVFIFALCTTLFEYIELFFEKVAYGHGWNIFWTFWSYVLPYFIIYRYHVALKKLGI
ncbi:CBO0543 family protein [Aneurinibacillus aneurinilyticus]|jgi:hypothetical protein|uniref:CBO0543 family protein n=1 Tax=Aneurinibacillus aneurinilyticus TaxID=1391 RepID=UPI0023F97B57|nr:CBO0543 family protein [Aneurinibacillus aneurinilyticus]MCI1695819.1 hypothetical protein [Aneurinibacillus aneurinilyticus]